MQLDLPKNLTSYVNAPCCNYKLNNPTDTNVGMYAYLNKRVRECFA